MREKGKEYDNMAEEGSAAKRWWAGLSPEEKLAVRQRIKEGMKRYWEGLSEDKRKQIGRNVSRAKKEAARVKKS
jgi:hypothetical protein